MKGNLRNERDINEQLEDEIKIKDEEIDHLKKCVKNKDEVANNLEGIFRDKTNEIEQLKDHCETLALQVGKERILERKLKIQDDLIVELKNNLKDREKEPKVEKQEEIETLRFEINQLEAENKLKGRLLEEVSEENVITQEKLKILEESKTELLEDMDKIKAQFADGASLSEELNLARTFVCKRCEKRFENKSELKMHLRNIHDLEEWKLKLLNKEKTVIGLKFKISSGLNKLKEKEAKTKYVCQCKGFCRLKHKIYNWMKPVSNKIASKSRDILEKKTDVEEELEPELFQCQNCDDIFETSRELKTHAETLQCIETCLVNPWGLNFMQ